MYSSQFIQWITTCLVFLTLSDNYNPIFVSSFNIPATSTNNGIVRTIISTGTSISTITTTTITRRKNEPSFRLGMTKNKNNKDEPSKKDFDRSDPNPGGMSGWEEDDSSANNTGGNDENFIDTLRAWFRSDEGREDIQTYTLSLVIALLLRLTIVEPRYIPSLSMYPTFDVGDQLAVEKVSKRIRPFNRNEIVVFNPPESFRTIMSTNYGVETKKSKEALIKRIVATEGDIVKVRSGKLIINDVQQDEPFTAEDAKYEFGPVQVPPGKVLVLGDNRNQSLDGHIWGFLPKENVIGRAVFIYWPPWRIGNTGMY